MKLLASLLGLAVIGAPLFVIVAAITGLCWWLYQDIDGIRGLAIIIKPLSKLIEEDAFMAIPLFIGAGAIMTEGGLAKRLVDVMRASIGWMPGGLAVASVVACMFFAAISGSSPVTLIAVGSIMFPALMQNRYPENFSLGLIMTAGSLGCLVPPAIAMLIYAIAVQGDGAVDPSELFIAGMVPALVIAGVLSMYSIYTGVTMADPGASLGKRLVRALLWTLLLFTGPGLLIVGALMGKFDFRVWARQLWSGFWALLLPIIVLGGIGAGLYVPSEAGAVAVVYALFVTAFVYRELDFPGVVRVLANAGKLMGMLILIIGLAFSLNEFLTAIEIDAKLEQLVRDWELGPVTFLLLVNLVLIILGALMDSISATLIFAPMLAPIAVNTYGMDPLHFGIVFVVNMEIGYLMPPVATNLFVAAAVFKKPFGQVARAVLPTLGMTCAALVLFMYVPTCSLGLVNLTRGEPVWSAFPWDGVDGTQREADPGGASALGNLSVQSMEDTMNNDGGVGQSADELLDELEDIYSVETQGGDGDSAATEDGGVPDLGGSFLEQFGGAGDDDDDDDE
ncbi:MAG TPA: TRAP transporter large permease [Kofleriaceae bacterium]|nr:TRAP transporter large permease [Kofleriaceae bacterium]